MARTLTFRPREERRAGWIRTLSLSLACSAATLALGFGLAGWMGGDMARTQAEQAAATARLELAAAVCAERFMQQADAPARLARLAALGWKERGELLARGGWATMPDRTAPGSETAMRCGVALGERYTSLQRTLPLSAPPR